MDGNFAQKSLRLFNYFSKNYSDIPRYITHSLINPLIARKTPIDLGIPWISWQAIDFLDNFLQSNMIVYEWGSGGSSCFLAQRTKYLYGIEHSLQWHQKVITILLEHGVDNTSLKLCSDDFANKYSFEKSEYFNSMPDYEFDVILVDAPPDGGRTLRPKCFYLSEKKIKPGGIIVVDDSWRYPELRIKNNAKKVQVFESIGPCRPGITSTDIFFY